MSTSMTELKEHESKRRSGRGVSVRRALVPYMNNISLRESRQRQKNTSVGRQSSPKIGCRVPIEK
jgi:hypothetical protein